MKKTDYILNLNATVGVKLTPSGIKMLKKEYLVPVQDEDGYYQLQLWELMGIFGKFMKNPSTQVGMLLEEMAIKVKHEDLE